MRYRCACSASGRKGLSTIAAGDASAVMPKNGLQDSCYNGFFDRYCYRYRYRVLNSLEQSVAVLFAAMRFVEVLKEDSVRILLHENVHWENSSTPG